MSFTKLKISKEGLDEFGAIFDPSKGDLEIIFNKYNDYVKKITQISRFINAMGTGFLREVYPEYNFNLVVDFSEMLGNDIAQHVYTKENVRENWNKFRDANSISEVIKLYSCLLPYDQYIRDKDKLSDYWIVTMNIGMRIFYFSNIDLHLLWMDERATAEIKKYLLTIINRIFVLSEEVYKMYVSLDVDNDEFSEKLIENLTRLQEVPELSRCNLAFKKIAESVDVFKSRANDYYCDFIVSKNPSVFIENFIVDVAQKQQEAPSALLAFQFKKIAKYHRKISAQVKQQNPGIRDMMNALDERMALLTKVKEIKNERMKIAEAI